MGADEPFQVGRVGGGDLDVAGLDGKEVPHRRAAEAFFEQGDASQEFNRFGASDVDETVRRGARRRVGPVARP